VDSALNTTRMDISTIIEEVQNNKAIILDVRTDGEWEMGHIRGAMHYDLARIEAGELPAIPKDTRIYTHCRSGGRATEALHILAQNGFTNVLCLGGYLDWKEMGGPVVE
jgi:hydroxyacylglutathione hydrolase